MDVSTANWAGCIGRDRRKEINESERACHLSRAPKGVSAQKEEQRTELGGVHRCTNMNLKRAWESGKSPSKKLSFSRVNPGCDGENKVGQGTRMFQTTPEPWI